MRIHIRIGYRDPERRERVIDETRPVVDITYNFTQPLAMPPDELVRILCREMGHHLAFDGSNWQSCSTVCTIDPWPVPHEWTP